MPAAGRSKCFAAMATITVSAAFEELDLAGVDVVLMRQDPPFDMAYITATHLLELLPEDGPLVVNDPAAVRNAPKSCSCCALRS